MHQQYEFDSRSIILMMDGDDAGGGVVEVEAGENRQERIDRQRARGRGRLRQLDSRLQRPYILLHSLLAELCSSDRIGRKSTRMSSDARFSSMPTYVQPRPHDQECRSF